MSIRVKIVPRGTLTTISACHIDAFMGTSTIIKYLALINICSNRKIKAVAMYVASYSSDTLISDYKQWVRTEIQIKA